MLVEISVDAFPASGITKLENFPARIEQVIALPD
jgi:hypothetical protein